MIWFARADSQTPICLQNTGTRGAQLPVELMAGKMGNRRAECALIISGMQGRFRLHPLR